MRFESSCRWMLIRSQYRHRHCYRLPAIFLLLLTIFVAVAPIEAQTHDGGLYGSIKDAIEPVAQPVRKSVCSRYNKLTDKGRFVAGACAGFGASRVAAGTAAQTVKTVGAAYIAFEALEYAGLLKEARTERNEQLIAQARDYFLRTVDGIRLEIRTQLNPKKIRIRIERGMEKDKAGTVGFGTGAFLGFAL